MSSSSELHTPSHNLRTAAVPRHHPAMTDELQPPPIPFGEAPTDPAEAAQPMAAAEATNAVPYQEPIHHRVGGNPSLRTTQMGVQTVKRVTGGDQMQADFVRVPRATMEAARELFDAGSYEEAAMLILVGE
jgi:hypothetical protein